MFNFKTIRKVWLITFNNFLILIFNAYALIHLMHMQNNKE